MPFVTFGNRRIRVHRANEPVPDHEHEDENDEDEDDQETAPTPPSNPLQRRPGPQRHASAFDQFQARVTVLQETEPGISNAKAIRAIAIAQPKLHAAYLREASLRRDARLRHDLGVAAMQRERCSTAIANPNASASGGRAA